MPDQYSHDDSSVRQVELVLGGYTVSTGEFAIGRIGTEYVMRNGRGVRVVLPSTTEREGLLAAWRAFILRLSYGCTADAATKRDALSDTGISASTRPLNNRPVARPPVTGAPASPAAQDRAGQSPFVTA